MRNYIFFIWASLLLLGRANASVLYSVTVDTSSMSGTSGSLDFNFNPGPLTTQSASLQILNYSSNGSLVSCVNNVQGYCPTGDVSGTLPGTLTFDNGSGFNDYFDDFTFGSEIEFQINLYGPEVDAPDGISTSGSEFAFSMFSNTSGTVPALTSDAVDGFAFTIDVNLDGTTSPSVYSSQTSVVQIGNATPEPGTFWSIILLGSISSLFSVSSKFKISTRPPFFRSRA